MPVKGDFLLPFLVFVLKKGEQNEKKMAEKDSYGDHADSSAG